jgi:hypothetical protein
MDALDVLYNVASHIGSHLSLRDCTALMLAHPGFRYVHAAATSHTWNVSKMSEADKSDTGIWQRKWNALVKIKPCIQELGINISNQALSKESLVTMLNTPVVKCLTVDINVNHNVLRPFAEALAMYNSGQYKIRLRLHFDHLSSLESAEDIKMLHSASALLKIECIINSTSSESESLWKTCISLEPSWIDNMTFTSSDGPDVYNITNDDIPRLLRIPELSITNGLHRWMDLDTNNSLIDVATTTYDNTILTITQGGMLHLEYISKRCKRLKRYVLQYMLHDISLLYGGQYLKMIMKDLDGSSIEELYLGDKSLVNPIVVMSLRQMMRYRQRPSLKIGIMVNTKDPLYALCAELVRRYVPDVILSLNNHAFKHLSKDAIMATLKTIDPIVFEAWNMMR